MSQSGITTDEFRYEFCCSQVNHLEQCLRKLAQDSPARKPIEEALGNYRGECAELKPLVKRMRSSRRGQASHGVRTRYDVMEDILAEIKGLRADLAVSTALVLPSRPSFKE